jgi:outer membrane protein insertion porin family
MTRIKARQSHGTWSVIVFFFTITVVITSAYGADEQSAKLSTTNEGRFFGSKKVHDIIIQGNKNVPTEAIRAKIPYHPGQVFKASASSDLIRNLYNLGYFKPTIQVIIDEISPQEVDIYVKLEEKELVDEIVFIGNDHLKREDIEKKVNLSELRGIDSDDLKRISQQIKELYLAKDYHNVTITEKIIPTSEGHARAEFHIIEGSYSLVTQVRFLGNHSVPSKKLRKLIFTRPTWLLGFLDKAGSYQPDAIEYDKYVLEHYYKSNGYFRAKVTNVDVQSDPASPCNYIVTFTIYEGDLYRFGNVCAVGNDVLTDQEILNRINIEPGDLYSSEHIRQTLELLRLVWGEYGYIFAETNPLIEPHDDTKIVDITFVSSLGSPVTLNRLTVSGNKKTKEKVVRREITFDEGDLITSRGMDESRERIERLGYFDTNGGVNWKTTRINDEEADLEMVLKETTTGKLFADFKFGGDGGDIQSPATGFQVGLGAQNRNWRGTGIKYNATAYFSWQDRQIGFSAIQPWLFDKPLQGGFDVYHRTSTYSDFKNVTESPKEQLTGGSVSFGFTTRQLGGASCVFDLGFDSIRYKERITADLAFDERSRQAAFQQQIDRIFQPGDLLWTGAQVIQDMRNNPVTPSRGYLWTSALKVGLPFISRINRGRQEGFGFVKWDADAHWYTPLISEYNLIFHLHGHVGLVNELGNFRIPYRELYHIGGPASVRGFQFGQIGPSLFGDSLGAKKAFWMNAELIFPITKDFNIIGLVFYDGGAGWDTPGALDIENIRETRGLLRNNNFNFRQAVGFGFKMRSPTPISIAVGLKLDHNKRMRESVSEVHFTSAVDF